jgi:PIN domain nuclease of toxin-antitoxin system
MSNAVTETQALIWYLEDNPKLNTAANEVFEQCDRGEIVIYSPTICLVFNWEDVSSPKLKLVSD